MPNGNTRTLAGVIAAARAACGAPLDELEVRAQLGAAAATAPTPRASAAERAALRRRIQAAGEPVPRELEPALARPPARRAAPRRVEADEPPAVGSREPARGLGLDWMPEDYARARGTERDRRGAERALAELPWEYARRVERAARAVRRDAGGLLVPARDWCHLLARRVVACAYVAWRASGMARRHGMARRVVGHDRSSWSRLFANRLTGQPLSANALFHGSKVGDGWFCGAMTALHRAGAWWCHQPPASEADYVGRGRGGEPRALAIYWLSCAALAAPLARELAAPLPAAAPAAAPVCLERGPP